MRTVRNIGGQQPAPRSGGIGNNFILRVKFLQPYDLASNSTNATSDKAVNFKTAIESLKASGIYVTLQTEASATKHFSSTSTPKNQKERLEKIRQKQAPISKLWTDGLSVHKNWRDQGVNRKKVS